MLKATTSSIKPQLAVFKSSYHGNEQKDDRANIKGKNVLGNHTGGGFLFHGVFASLS